MTTIACRGVRFVSTGVEERTWIPRKMENVEERVGKGLRLGPLLKMRERSGLQTLE